MMRKKTNGKITLFPVILPFFIYFLSCCLRYSNRVFIPVSLLLPENVSGAALPQSHPAPPLTPL